MLNQAHFKIKTQDMKKLSVNIGSAVLLSIASLSANASGSDNYTKPAVNLNSIVPAQLKTASDLDSILSAQPEEVQQRYQYRNPKETLEFFQIEPGMKVMEVLPGRGWYTKILLPFLGAEGELVGVDYPQAMWPHFSFMTPERIEGKKTWVSTWTEEANTWRNDSDAKVSAFQFAEMPESISGTVDAALYIRALHNLNRHQDKDDYLGTALKETYAALKPGGLLGFVQHHAREDRQDEWADGNNGYLKQSFVIETMGKYGFEFVAQSDINANPKDQAKEGDNVWRLLPSLRSDNEDPEHLKALEEIGESNRMTLLFKKPNS